MPPSFHDDLGPARWAQVAVAALGLGVSLYLAACQLGWITPPWEPLFAATRAAYANGSDQVLHAPAARFLPIPDALLGAIAYALRLALTLVGNHDRALRKPWAPLVAELLSTLLVLVSAGLVAIQAFVVHAWCTLCLLSAACSVALLLLSLPESWQALRQVRTGRARGQSLWSAVAPG